MRVWIDAQMPPLLAARLCAAFSLDATHVFDLGFVAASDSDIYEAARGANAIIVTKDADFIRLLETRGPPPQILWVTIGNARDAVLCASIEAAWPRARALFEAGEPLVEIQQLVS